MPEITQDIMIFRVDFNNMDASGHVKGSFAHALSDRVPHLGERVLLCDAEGNACWSTVTHVGTLTLRFELDPVTWTSGDDMSASGVPLADRPVLSWSPELAPA